MSGIRTHIQDPINPTKASAIIPQTASNGNSGTPSGSTQSRTFAPTPTNTVASTSIDNPPPPQPGATPVPQPTAKPVLPPPPKDGEALTSYASINHVHAQSQPTPAALLGPNRQRHPGTSATSTATDRTFADIAPQTNLFAQGTSTAEASRDHPPGYVQNPYASDMTPDQRFMIEQRETQNGSGIKPSLDYNDNASKKGSVLHEDDNMWNSAVEWGKEKGKQLGDLHEKVWDSIGGK